MSVAWEQKINQLNAWLVMESGLWVWMRQKEKNTSGRLCLMKLIINHREKLSLFAYCVVFPDKKVHRLNYFRKWFMTVAQLDEIWDRTMLYCLFLVIFTKVINVKSNDLIWSKNIIFFWQTTTPSDKPIWDMLLYDTNCTHSFFPEIISKHIWTTSIKVSKCG